MVKFSKKEYTDDELNFIAGRGISPYGLYSWKSVYDEFIKAGLSKEQSRKETDKRVWMLD